MAKTDVADAPEGEATTEAPKAKTPKPKVQVLCRSGSGQMTSRTFAPGGDAKYKSALIANVLNGGPVDAKAETERLKAAGYDEEYIKQAAAGVITAKRAEAILAERGWTKFLIASQAKAERKATKAAEREAAREAARAKRDEEREAKKAAAAAKAEEAKATKAAAKKAAPAKKAAGASKRGARTRGRS